MNLVSLKKIDLDQKFLAEENDGLKIYRGYGHYYVVFDNCAKLSDALFWKDLSEEACNLIVPIKSLIVFKGKCAGYITNIHYGIDGMTALNKTYDDLEKRKILAYFLVDLYEKLNNKGMAYTNWTLQDILIENTRKFKLTKPHFLVDIVMHNEFDSPILEYNFCEMIFSILYGIDFSVVNAEEIPDLNIPEAIKDVLGKRKNEKITLPIIKDIIRYTKNEFVIDPQIQKLKRTYNPNN
ncbi:MAG: hypothetical protein IJO33_03455 [Bacilli bacterium]|nr:hypothetical protein [Bacilli bacterium]